MHLLDLAVYEMTCFILLKFIFSKTNEHPTAVFNPLLYLLKLDNEQLMEDFDPGSM